MVQWLKHLLQSHDRGLDPRNPTESQMNLCQTRYMSETEQTKEGREEDCAH